MIDPYSREYAVWLSQVKAGDRVMYVTGDTRLFATVARKPPYGYLTLSNGTRFSSDGQLPGMPFCGELQPVTEEQEAAYRNNYTTDRAALRLALKIAQLPIRQLRLMPLQTLQQAAAALFEEEPAP